MRHRRRYVVFVGAYKGQLTEPSPLRIHPSLRKRAVCAMRLRLRQQQAHTALFLSEEGCASSMRLFFPLGAQEKRSAYKGQLYEPSSSSLLRLGKEQYAPKGAPFVPCMRLLYPLGAQETEGAQRILLYPSSPLRKRAPHTRLRQLSLVCGALLRLGRREGSRAVCAYC